MNIANSWIKPYYDRRVTSSEKTLGEIYNELTIPEQNLVNRLIGQASQEFREKNPKNLAISWWIEDISERWRYGTNSVMDRFNSFTTEQKCITYFLIERAAEEAYAKTAFMKKAREKRHDDLPWFGGAFYGTKARIPLLPTKIIFSGPKCIVFWNDHSKTIISKSENDPYDEHAAFCAAYAKRMFGSTSRVKKMVNRIAVGYPDKKKEIDAK